MFTAFDVGVAILVLISAILAAVRGLTREVLSLATWAGSAAIAAYAVIYHSDFAMQYVQGELVAQIATGVIVFVVALVILHLITMKLADWVVDSKIGPLDRTLGFVFGVLRGGLIAVVVVIFGKWLLPTQLPSWAAESRSLPVLEQLGDRLIQLLPDDLEKQVTDMIQQGLRRGDETPPDENTTTTDGGTDATDGGTDAPENGSTDGAPADGATAPAV